MTKTVYNSKGNKKKVIKNGGEPAFYILDSDGNWIIDQEQQEMKTTDVAQESKETNQQSGTGLSERLITNGNKPLESEKPQPTNHPQESDQTVPVGGMVAGAVVAAAALMALKKKRDKE